MNPTVDPILRGAKDVAHSKRAQRITEGSEDAPRRTSSDSTGLSPRLEEAEGGQAGCLATCQACAFAEMFAIGL